MKNQIQDGMILKTYSITIFFLLFLLNMYSDIFRHKKNIFFTKIHVAYSREMFHFAVHSQKVILFVFLCRCVTAQENSAFDILCPVGGPVN